MICQTQQQADVALKLLDNGDLWAYDTETDGLNVRRNRVIGFGASNGTDSFYIVLWTFNGTDLVRSSINPQAILEKLKTKKLIAWNMSFDARITKQSLGVDLLPALHADGMLLKHTVDEEYPFGLKEVASKLWGTDVTKEKEEMQASIKANGGTAKQYYKADVSLLGKYCIQDCLLTMRCFDYYNRRLLLNGLQAFYYTEEVLPLYREVVIPMEERGVHVDLPLLERSKAEIAVDIAKLEEQIQASIAPLLPDVFVPWLLNKDYPLKTATGKQPKWAKDGLTQLQAWQRDNCETNAYMFNLQSKFHLKKLFFDTLKEQPLSRTPTGMPQVDDDFIQHVAPKYPWAALLSDYNKLKKIEGTYVLRLLEEQENGIFYPTWLAHGTVSGRLSGDMQQLPRPIEHGSEVVKKHNNRIRQFIIAQPGHQLCSADYEQLEPTIFSHCSTDTQLQSIFNDNRDFYSEVAIKTEGLAYSSDKKAPNYLGKVDKAKRQMAKAYALGIAYGMSGYKLQFEIGVSQAEADQLVANYLDAFPGLAAWMESSRHQAITSGFVRTQSGRIRHLPEAKRLHAKYGTALDNALETWKAYNASPKYGEIKQARKRYQNQINNARNFQVQGLAASIVNRAAIRLARELKTAQLGAAIQAQIHDELLLTVPVHEIDTVSIMVKTIMESIMPLSVPLRTEPQFGACFKDCK